MEYLTMRKFFNGAVAFVLAVALSATFASCHRDESGSEPMVTDVLVNDAPVVFSKTLVVKSNVAATFAYGGVTKGTATEATFENANAKGTLVVTPDAKAAQEGYLPQTIDVSFGEEDWKQVNVQLYKLSANAAFQTPGEELRVENDLENQKDNELEDENTGLDGNVKAVLVVPADAGNTGNTAEPYSITVFKPHTDEDKNVLANSTIEDAVLALDCRPDGARFTNPVKVNLYIPGSENLNLRVVNRQNRSERINLTRGEENSLTVELTHFSIYDIMMLAKVISINRSDSVIYDNSFEVSAGRQQFYYDRQVGYVADNSAKSLIGQFLDNTFGVPMFLQENVPYTFNATVAGTAHVTLSQRVTSYEFESRREDDPNKFTRFSVVVYGAVKSKVELTHPATSDTEIHSGGSND